MDQNERDVITKILSEPSIIPAGSSALPNEKLIHNTGYVLARLSVISLMTKNWSQVFWINYGPSALLFFKNKKMADDWMKNPLLSLKKRNSLILMKLDFIKELEKPGMNGFRATQITSKSYGKKTLCVLSRFMFAFGSNEVPHNL